MIISGGENVFPREIEDLLHLHPGVLEAAAVGVPDEQFGQRLSVFVVRGEGAELTEDDSQAVRARQPRPLQGAARGRLPRRAAAQPDRQGSQARTDRAAEATDGSDDRQPHARRQCCVRAHRGRRHALARGCAACLAAHLCPRATACSSAASHQFTVPLCAFDSMQCSWIVSCGSWVSLERIPPWRARAAKGTRNILELAAGEIARTGVAIGDQLAEIETAMSIRPPTRQHAERRPSRRCRSCRGCSRRRHGGGRPAARLRGGLRAGLIALARCGVSRRR